MPWAVEEFESVFRSRYPELVRIGHGFTGSRDAAEDVAQEAFLRLWRAGPTRRPSADYWLFRTARNLALDWLKTERRRKHREMHARPEENPAVFSDGDVVRVRRLVRELPERSREVLLLREFTGLTYAEIAAVVGRTENVVKQDLHRARERLRAAWERRFNMTPEEG